jgi:hypothetical protein
MCFLLPVLDRPSLLVTSHPFRYVAPLFALPALTYTALASELSSPTPDLASTIVQIVLFVFLCDSIGRWREGHLVQDYRATLLLLLAATAVTIKLSNLAFSATIALFVAAYWMQTSPRSIQGFLKIIIPGGAIILLWGFRGFLLSGAPFYPSTIGYIPVKWAVPRETVVEEAMTIYRWARRAGVEWNSIFSDWDWFQTWWFQRSSDFVSFKYPIYISALFFVLAVVVTLATKRRTSRKLEWCILSLPVVSLIYWFLTAPLLRFANSLFFLLSISTCLLLILSLQSVINAKILAGLLMVVFFLGNAHFIQYSIKNKWLLKPCAQVGTWVACIPSADWRPIPEIPLTTQSTSSGLEIFIPITGDQCWDAPLPCAPYLNPSLTLKKQGDLSSGFSVTTK